MAERLKPRGVGGELSGGTAYFEFGADHCEQVMLASLQVWGGARSTSTAAGTMPSVLHMRLCMLQG